MQTILEHVTARLWLGAHRAVESRDSDSPAHSRVLRAADHPVVLFVACSAWVIALASVVAWATGYAVGL